MLVHAGWIWEGPYSSVSDGRGVSGPSGPMRITRSTRTTSNRFPRTTSSLGRRRAVNFFAARSLTAASFSSTFIHSGSSGMPGRSGSSGMGRVRWSTRARRAPCGVACCPVTIDQDCSFRSTTRKVGGRSTTPGWVVNARWESARTSSGKRLAVYERWSSPTRSIPSVSPTAAAWSITKPLVREVSGASRSQPSSSGSVARGGSRRPPPIRANSSARTTR